MNTNKIAFELSVMCVVSGNRKELHAKERRLTEIMNDTATPAQLLPLAEKMISVLRNTILRTFLVR